MRATQSTYQRPLVRRRLMPAEKLQHAKNMRDRPTPAEAVLWDRLKRKREGFKVRNQAPMWGYIADFYVAECGLCIEVDGGYHRAQADAERDANLARHGIFTLRFSNDEVLTDVESVVETIRNAVFANSQRTSKKATRRHNPARQPG